MSHHARLMGRRASVALIVGTTIVLAGGPPSSASCAGDPQARAEVVVKVDVAHGRTINEITATQPVVIAKPLLASRGLYVVKATDPQYCATFDWAKKLADQVEDHPAVEYAEPNYQQDLSDSRFHAWPQGANADAGTDPKVWTGQTAAQQLRLVEANRISRGAGIIVAVLDTGIDATHPMLKNRLLPGWDYVQDDSNPTEARDGKDDDTDGLIDESYGHGTFVSGTVALVAPDAKVLPMRVLDSDGRGNVFVVAEAIDDAVESGADVINLAFGTPYKPDSPWLEDAIKDAQKRGAVIVVSAGNVPGTNELYPAAQSEVFAVTALSEDAKSIASFANSGGWVDIAAPGTKIVGPVPGGRFAVWSGTSLAAPFVAGQIALIRSIRPNLDAVHAVDVVTHSTTQRADSVYRTSILASLKYRG